MRARSRRPSRRFARSRARGPPSSPRLVRVAARRYSRARAPRVAAPRFRPVRPDDVAARRRFLDARVSRAPPRAAATDAPGGDASDAETERPARRVRRLPRRGGKPDTGDRAEARATAAATDPPRDDETDDESDAPQVFDMRELYGDDYDFDDEDEDDEEAMDEDALDAALASMSSPPSSASDASDVRVLPPLSAQLLSGDPRGTSPGTSPSSAAQTRARARS